MRTLSTALLLFLLVAVAAGAQTYDTYNYWLMPQGLVAQTSNLLWNGTTVPGEHCFWRGSLWGRTVALQGDPSFTSYDLFVDGGSRLEYWATFRGNGYNAPVSHSFGSPFYWMNRFMAVGNAMENALPVKALDSQLRKVSSSGTVTMRLEVNAHYDTWTLPETGVTYSDVLQVTFWSDKNVPASREVYYLANGKGTIRFESSNNGEPSGVRVSWATSFVNKAVNAPSLPWFDPFQNTTFVPNGFFQDITSGVNGGLVSTYMRSWSGISNDVVITTDGTDPGAGNWKIALRGWTGGGDSAADAAITTAFIPVTPGKTYRLSGWLWRVSASDNLYLDFNDGLGQGGNFTDGQAVATATNTWEYRSVDVRVGPSTTGIKVRCVRDGANSGNGYCDGIQLQPVD
ncbi:MAG TPA: hypothetical protein VHC97_05255 [Thermoanaerobaculia bacterium]|jgi:hypothetical protein|nr:hypothetical protein [Thermoanaerobaculia bacterium]